MPLPSQPVTLSAQQVEDLRVKLSTMQHRINNQLALIVASVELIRIKPQSAERMMETLGEQSPRIQEEHEKFSAEFNRALGITRP